MSLSRSTITVGALLSAAAFAVAPVADASGHRWQLAPNGASPWLYSQSWRQSGSYFGEGLHNDTYTDYYATDWTNASGSSCGQPVYPIWNNLRVSYVDRVNNGSVYMETTSGPKLRVKLLHMSPINVKVGDLVGTKTVIGRSNSLMGGKYNSANCHIHFAVHAKDANGTWTGIVPQLCGAGYPRKGMTLKGC